MKSIEDTRSEGKVIYPLHEIVMVAYLAIMAGASTIADIANFANDKNKWLEKYFMIKHGVPSHDTFRRVLSLIDPAYLQTATVAFLIDNIKVLKRAFKIETGIKQYCVDGKVARGTGRLKDTDREIKQLQTLHIYDRTDDIGVVSKAINEKTNEIPVAQAMLKMMDLRGAIVSFDSLHTQLETISIVTGQKGNYVAALKGNQPSFHDEVASYFTPKRLKQIKDKKNGYVEFSEKAHNCIEIRKYYLSKNVSWLTQINEWKGLKSIIFYSLHKENLVTGKITDETYCYIASITDVNVCADAIRGHWSVEVLHWHLDCNFGEDDTEIIDRNAFQNFSLLNKMALSLSKLIAPLLKCSVRSTRKRVGWDVDILLKAFCILDEDILAETLKNVKTR
jgi:predicted transposase YbfD/YdcC